MFSLEVRNVHHALPRAVDILRREGRKRPSRNGEVIVAPFPVTTVYSHPTERVIFWPQRDANPAFHLYEALWMLDGRSDVEPLTRYVKRFIEFSDDGIHLAGAYGHRWRNTHDEDQLEVIAEMLRKNHDERRAVLQIWDASYDLGSASRDVPCNLIATFQHDSYGALEMTVFCRSNDIVWGAYGANAVHFSMLQEYLAAWIGCQTGLYRQVSVNWHAYPQTLAPLMTLPRPGHGGLFSVPLDEPLDDGWDSDPYSTRQVHSQPLVYGLTGDAAISEINLNIRYVLQQADTGYVLPDPPLNPFFSTANTVLKAHHLWRTLPAPERYEQPLDLLGTDDTDWIVAMRQWIHRRFAKWDAKMTAGEAHG